MFFESVARDYDQKSTLSSDNLEGLQKRAELLQFEYFALIFPDISVICSDGKSQTFAQQTESSLIHLLELLLFSECNHKCPFYLH